MTRVLPYRPDQLFELVGDIGEYPTFVPWVTSMRVRNARQEGAGVTACEADATVGFSFLKERFTTKVRRDANQRLIEVTLISGPFKHLTNTWRFKDHPRGCEVSFFIDFAFKSRLLDMILNANFNLAVDRLIHCFEARARTLYGPSAGDPAASPAR
jgi:coenzyme Q-binding protein COQ10